MSSKQSPVTATYSQADLLDIHMFIYGYQQWQIKEEGASQWDMTSPDELRAQGLDINRTEPFTASCFTEFLDKALDDGIAVDNLGRFPPEKQVEFMENLKRLGLESFLDDGKITTEEMLVTASEVGKALIEKNPEKYQFSDEALESAKEILAKYGIDDPDGSMARGFAANTERITQRVNEGLGLESPSAAPQQPEYEADTSYTTTAQTYSI